MIICIVYSVDITITAVIITLLVSWLEFSLARLYSVRFTTAVVVSAEPLHFPLPSEWKTVSQHYVIR